MMILLFSIANTNSAVYNVLEAGGNSMKTVLTVDKRFPSFSQQMDKKYHSIKFHKNLQKMIKISFQDVFSVGLTLMRTKKRKLAIFAVVILFTRDV